MVELETSVATAEEELATAVEVRQEADTAAEKARAGVESGQQRVAEARRGVDQLADREEADRLQARLAKIDAAQRELAGVECELSAIALTEAGLRAIEKAKSAVDIAAGQVELVATHVQLTAFADVEVSVDGEAVDLASGDAWSAAVSAETEIAVPGLFTVRLSPGTSAADMRAKLAAAQQVLATELANYGVGDIAAARSEGERRQQLAGSRDRLSAAIEAMTAEQSVDRLRARLAELTERWPVVDALFDIDADAARAELDAATAALQQAIAQGETQRKVAEAAAKQLGDREIRVNVLREKLLTARTEIVSARERLTEQRTTTSDDELTVRAATHQEQAVRARTLVAQIEDELAESAPTAVAAEFEEAARHADALSRRHDTAAETLRDVAAALKVFGTEGRKGKLDAAATEREHAAAEHLRVQRRARAAQLLRTVIARHRDATRLRYVDPFRSEVERLGRIVFGDSFEVEIDSGLRICSRTLAGRTVPYESLSGGAKEQLGIVARLASAALVAKEDSVPVLIDDALGFTDADRLTKMGAVFNAVGGDGQVIVLTCSPDRYAGVEGAHHIELTA
jgi:hypothetical protein